MLLSFVPAPTCGDKIVPPFSSICTLLPFQSFIAELPNLFSSKWIGIWILANSVLPLLTIQPIALLTDSSSYESDGL